MWPKQVAHKKDVAWPQIVFHRKTKYQYHQHDNKKKQRYTLQNMKHLGSPTTLGDIVSPANHQLKSKATLLTQAKGKKHTHNLS